MDRHAGAGLGLSICKAIVEKYRGSMNVESALGVGSTFRVSLDLPLASQHEPSTSVGAAATDAPDLAMADPLDGCHVLVVDDVDMNRDVCCEMLRMFGCTVAEACDGADAVVAVREQRERGHPFDAVLMDVQMPRMNGGEAAAAIRVMEAEAATERLPIVALTGFAGSEERERCLASGMDECAHTPLSKASLPRLWLPRCLAASLI